MASTIGEAFVALRSDDSRLQGDIESQLTKALGPVVAKGAKILAGLFVGKQVVGVARAGIAELAEAEKQSALVAAQLTATGSAAGITQGHINDLAAANLQLAGTDDEVTLAAERVLLQFSRITAAGGVFDEALKSAQDLAVVNSEELPAAARSLGLALQDPIHATRLLRSENVALSTSQQAQIKALVESGNVLGAQRIILDQVSAAVGGTAAAFGDTLGGDLQRAQEELENTKASLLEGTAPALSVVADASVIASEAIQGLPVGLRTIASTAVLAGSGLLSLLPTISALRTNTLSAAASRATLASVEAAATAATVTDTAATAGLVVAEGALVAEAPAVVASQAAVGAGFTAMLGPLALVVAGIGLAVVAWKSIGHGALDVQTDLKGAVPSVDEFASKLDKTTVAVLRASGGSVQLAESVAKQSIPAARNLNEALRAQGLSTDEVTAAIDRQEQANLSATAGSKGMTAAEYEQAEAERILLEAQSARFDAITGSITAERAYERSVRDVESAQRGAESASRALTDAQDALTEARRGASAEEITKAELSIESARISAGNAAKTVADEEALLQRLRSGMRGTVDELASAEDRLTSARESQRRANQSLAELQREARINFRRGIALTHEQRLAIEDAARSAQAAAKSTADEEAKLAELRSPASAAAIADQETKVALAKIASQQATFAVTDAEVALQSVQAQGTESDQQVIDSRQRVADASQNLTDANVRVSDSYVSQVDAIAANRDAQNLLNGVTVTAATRAGNLRVALGQLLNQFAPGSQERRNIEDEIAALDLLAVKATQSFQNTDTLFKSLFGRTFSGMFGIRAASGFAGTVTRPTSILAGEGGRPEDVLIVPHSQGGIAAGGGGVVFGPGAVVVNFHGAVPSAAEAFRTGQAVGAGVADTLERRQVALAAKIA